MLRITGLSLLLGLAMLVTGLAMLSPSSTATGNTTLRMTPQQAIDSMPGSKAFVKDGILHLPSPDNGVEHVPFRLAATIKAEDFPFLHISIVEPRAEHTVFLTWRSPGAAPTKHRYKIENLKRDSQRIISKELPRCAGELP